MAPILDSSPLDPPDCVRRLESGMFGRVALATEAMPAIYPVTYRLVNDAIAFGAAEDTRLSTATNGVVVAFEVDGVDEDLVEGWSVLVVGTARRGQLFQSGTPRDRTAGPPVHEVLLPVETISGQRLRIDRSMDDVRWLRERAGAAIERSKQIVAHSESLVADARAEVEDLTREIASLKEALSSRTAISSAVGMLMSRGGVTSDEAFDVLRRASQRANRKLRDIAAELVERHEAQVRRTGRG